MANHFKRLYAYNTWANELFCTKLTQINCSDKFILRLFSHIYNAQAIWLNRINGMQNKVGVWDEYGLEECVSRLTQSNVAWRSYIDNQDTFENEIASQNSLGQPFVMNLGDIVMHVANHGTHHRGQISTLLRQQDIDPPQADLYYFALSEK